MIVPSTLNLLHRKSVYIKKYPRCNYIIFTFHIKYLVLKQCSKNQQPKRPKSQPAKPRHNHLIRDLLFKHLSFFPTTHGLIALFPYLCFYLFHLFFTPHTSKPLSRSSCSMAVNWRPNQAVQSPVLLHTQSKQD